jgi:DNA-binding NarL/FixJ family response regulator
MKDDQRTRILLAEDEFITALALSRYLINIGYDVVKVVSKGEDLIAETKNLNPELIISDIFLKDNITGLQALHTLENYDRKRIIIISGNSDAETLRLVNELNPCKFMLKPLSNVHLRNSIENCLKVAASTYE